MQTLRRSFVFLIVMALGCGGNSSGTSSTDVWVTPDLPADLPVPDVALPEVCNNDSDCENAVDSFGCVVPRCVNGTCSTGPAVQGTPCNDQDSCTQNDQCVVGVCQGEPIDCNDDDVCTDDTCVDGTCANLPNTASCDDSNPCTIVDSCNAGNCAGLPRDCDDDNVCTDDSCDPDPDSGGCINAANTSDCDDGDLCTENNICLEGTCIGDAVDCDDDNVCTADSCDSVSGCVYGIAVGSCNDDQDCTVEDACSYGLCRPGSWDIVAESCDIATCGDNICDAEESCVSCPHDCGTCCGDGVCNADHAENCLNCGADCGVCAQCGDGVCASEFGEDCDNCVQDCPNCGIPKCSSNGTLSCDEPIIVDLDGGETTDAVNTYSCSKVHENSYEGPERSYTFNAQCTGFVTVKLKRIGGTGGFADVMILDGTQPCRGDACLFASQMDTANAEGGVVRLGFKAHEGRSYRVVIDGRTQASGTYKLSVSCPCSMPPESCQDSVDNDLDQKTDCNDPLCAEDAACQGVEANCTDGIDNDFDGLTDCVDESCVDSPQCENQICPTGIVVFCGSVGNGFVGGAGNTELWDDYSCLEGAYTGPEQVFQLVPDCDGAVQVDWTRESGASGSIDFAVYGGVGSCGEDGGCIAGAASGEDGSGSVQFSGYEGSVYTIVADSQPGTTGAIQLAVSCTCGPVEGEQCGNLQDDDHDEKVDCADPDCDGHPACVPENCDSGLDTNTNFLIGCFDPSCQDSGLCLAEGDGCTVLGDAIAVPDSWNGSTKALSDRFSVEAGVCGAGSAAFGLGMPDRFHRINIPQDGWYRIKVSPLDAAIAAPAIAVLDLCSPASGYWCLGSSTDNAEIHVYLDSAYTHVVVVDGLDESHLEGVDYKVMVEATEGDCSDGLDADNDGWTDCADLDCVSNTQECPFQGDSCLEAIEVNGAPFAQTSNTSFATNTTDVAIGVCPGLGTASGSASPDVFYQFTADQSGMYQFSLTSNLDDSFDSVLRVVDGCEGSCLLGNDVSGPGGEQVNMFLLTGQTVILVIDGFSNLIPQSGLYQLVIDKLEPNCGDGLDDDDDGFTDCDDPDCLESANCVFGDTCSSPVVIDAATLPASYDGNTVAASPDYGFSNFSCPGETAARGNGSPDVVFEFTADQPGRYLFQLDPDATDFNSVLYATSSCGDTVNDCIAADDDETDGGEALILSLDTGETVYIVVDGWSPFISVSGSFRLNASFLGVSEVSCLDSVDNDGDTLVDCEDSDCAGVSICPDLGITCGEAVVLNTVPSIFYGDTFGGQDQLQADVNACSGLPLGAGGTAPDVKLRFTAPESAIYRAYLDPLATEFDASIYALSGCNALANCLGGADAPGLGGDELLIPIAEGMEVVFVIDGATQDLALQGEFLFHLESTGPREILCTDGLDGDDDSFTDCEDEDCSEDPSCPKPGDNCETATDISTLPMNAQQDIDLRTDSLSLNEPCSELPAGTGSGGKDAVFHWVAEQTGTYLAVLPVGTQGFDASLYVLSSCSTSSCLGASDSFGLGGGIVEFTAQQGEERYIVVDSIESDASGQFLLGVFFVGSSEVDCQDGLDDDGDNQTDCEDTDCAGDENCTD